MRGERINKEYNTGFCECPKCKRVFSSSIGRCIHCKEPLVFGRYISKEEYETRQEISTSFQD